MTSFLFSPQFPLVLFFARPLFLSPPLTKSLELTTDKMDQNPPITTHTVTVWTRWSELLFPELACYWKAKYAESRVNAMFKDSGNKLENWRKKIRIGKKNRIGSCDG